MSSHSQTQVKRRRVFYIPGYDPFHPRRYRELYRTEAAEQARVSSYNIALKPSPKGANFGWQVDAVIDDQSVHTDVEVLVWSDLVRDSMDNSIIATYRQLIQTAWIYITSGALFRLMRLRKGPVIAALYPVGMLIFQLIMALIIGGLLSAVIKSLLTGFIGQVIATAVSLAVFVFVLRWFKSKDGKVFAYYLMHDYAYSAQSRGAIPAELEQRMSSFRIMIADALQSDVDEVLVVGHSSGAHLGISILSDLLKDQPPSRATLSFLTLGQVVPMVSFLPDATRLRADLQFLSTCTDLTWVDVTAPGDGCSFALCDPVSVSGVAPSDKRWPLIFSAAFTQTLSPERWKELRWRFFRLHFQYLCAFDRPNDYNYFQITAGPLTLGHRYKDRKPSKSRIEKPVNKHTSIAA
ncbi:MAG: hypothetical protein ABJD13_01625 [Paracoccaceae bacterium]